MLKLKPNCPSLASYLRLMFARHSKFCALCGSWNVAANSEHQFLWFSNSFYSKRVYKCKKLGKTARFYLFECTVALKLAGCHPELSRLFLAEREQRKWPPKTPRLALKKNKTCLPQDSRTSFSLIRNGIISFIK